MPLRLQYFSDPLQNERFQILGSTKVDKSPYLSNGETGPRLPLITHKKSHKPFQMTRKSPTLN